jgi:hypothetical protein
MIDVTTNKPIKVVESGDAPGSIDVPVIQLDEIRRVLDSHGLRYWVSEHYGSINGGPQRTLIVLYHATDAKAVQSALDQAI